jgi:hypothetical protein
MCKIGGQDSCQQEDQPAHICTSIDWNKLLLPFNQNNSTVIQVHSSEIVLFLHDKCKLLVFFLLSLSLLLGGLSLCISTQFRSTWQTFIQHQVSSRLHSKCLLHSFAGLGGLGEGQGKKMNRTLVLPSKSFLDISTQIIILYSKCNECYNSNVLKV